MDRDTREANRPRGGVKRPPRPKAEDHPKGRARAGRSRARGDGGARSVEVDIHRTEGVLRDLQGQAVELRRQSLELVEELRIVHEASQAPISSLQLGVQEVHPCLEALQRAAQSGVARELPQ